MLRFLMFVANSIHSPHPLLRERRFPRPGRGALCVKTHLQPRPTVSVHLATKSSRIRSSAKHTHNPFRMRSFKTQDLKSFRIRIYKKTGGGGQTRSAIAPSMRWKKNSPPRTTTMTMPEEASSRAPGGCPCPVNAHRKPSITPAMGFSPYSHRHR